MKSEPESVTREEVEELEDAVLENRKLLTENNQILRKLHRSNIWAFWLRLVWIAIILGLPFLIYYYFLQPYYQSIDGAFQYFGVELPNIPSFGSDK